MSENENNQYRLLSPWAYVGYGILFTLPVIGWILAIVFALNDDNLNRRNFARGYWCGVLVAAFILWSGINAVRDTLDPLLGTPPTHEFVQRIRDLVMAHSTILGIHDLIVHDYGPGRVMISLHAEVPANEDVLALHDEIDNVEKELREKLGCDAVIHMDPVVTDDGVTEETRRRVQTLIHCIDDAIDIHDFRMVAGPTHTNLIFDAVVPFGFRLTDQEVEQKIRSAVRALDGNYYAVVNVERSYT